MTLSSPTEAPPRTPWHRQPFAVFDFETTGVRVFHDQVIQVATTLIDCSVSPPRVEPTAFLVNPGIEIPAGATAIHGITTEMVREHGRPADEAIEVTSNLVANLMKARIPIVGMNLVYDLTMLDAECRRYGVMNPEQLAGHQYDRIIDVYVLDKHVDRYRRGARKLEDLCRQYGVRHGGAHDAAEDGMATGRVAFKLALLFPELADMDVRDLHRSQVTWKAEQAAGLEAHWRKQGKTGMDGLPITVDRCWPVCRDLSHDR